jgi:CDGSH-type Zn-finger protein/uncharacterized Fe-S cluster protein YjdI
VVSKIRAYEGQGITVQYEIKRCIHAEKCVHGLLAVFNPQERPWIQPQNAAVDEIAEVIEHCPTGALHFVRADGITEATPEGNSITIQEDGPLYVRGNLEIVNATGSLILNDTRLALCRCGESQFKPFCDNSHIAAGFTDPGTPAVGKVEDLSGGATKLVITPNVNGPLQIDGDFQILSAEGQVIFQGTQAWLCRCGGSQNKPFCDSTHRKNGFQAE